MKAGGLPSRSRREVPLPTRREKVRISFLIFFITCPLTFGGGEVQEKEHLKTSSESPHSSSSRIGGGESLRGWASRETTALPTQHRADKEKSQVSPEKLCSLSLPGTAPHENDGIMNGTQIGAPRQKSVKRSMLKEAKKIKTKVALLVEET